MTSNRPISPCFSALPVLEQRIHGISVDAVEGRQGTDVLDDITAAASAGSLGRNVLIDTGYIGPISPRQLRTTLTALYDRRRVVLTLRRAAGMAGPEQRDDRRGRSVIRHSDRHRLARPDRQRPDWL